MKDETTNQKPNCLISKKYLSTNVKKNQTLKWIKRVFVSKN